MEDIAGIIAQFADYLSKLISYIKEIFDSFTKKDKADASAE